MKIHNRRYTGSKYKLTEWIKTKMQVECPDAHSFFDVFGGTGVVTAECLGQYDHFIINDFLYSNEVIYRGFFQQSKFNKRRLDKISNSYSAIDPENVLDNYVSINYGNKYFSYNDAKMIGFIRQDIEDKFSLNQINSKEYYILLSSLLYSFDRISNTVGHYEAYIKGKPIPDLFEFELIEPFITNKEIEIFREDSNQLVKRVSADIAFIDPPYNSRQYSRFYHVLETIIKWDFPELKGVAMKPPEENMSEYCRNKAPETFRDLIQSIKAKYIVVTYNNTYDSKSTSSQNKITLDQIKSILETKGDVVIFDHYHSAFNAGKTDLQDHKEFLFICKVYTHDSKPVRSPLFYVGDKYKLMPQLRELFPQYISNYIEPFVGGGSSFLNTTASHYYLNDIDKWITEIHKTLNSYTNKKEELISELYRLIDHYGLTCTFRGIDVPDGYRKKYVKTYFARANKESYLHLRDDYNKDQADIVRLYLLLIYGFNHMVRFNSKGLFNLPVGNVDFNKNVHEALLNYLRICENLDLHFSNQDYKDFLESVPFDKDSYVYLDPPYLISYSEYNKFWNESNEIELYNTLDELNKKGVRFGITNLIKHKGLTNTILQGWASNYRVYNINSNYISFNDNTIKADSQEVFVTNYGGEKV